MGVQLLGPRKQIEARPIAEAGADARMQAGDGLEVVSEHIGPGLDHPFQRVARSLTPALEVGNEHLDPAARHRLANGPDRRGPVRARSVVLIVTSDSGHYGELQTHEAHGLGDLGGFLGIEGLRLRRHDVAETTTSSAEIAAQQEGRLARLPTFVDIGTVGLLAHGCKSAFAHYVAQLGEVLALLDFDLEPLRSSLRPGRVLAGRAAQGNSTPEIALDVLAGLDSGDERCLSHPD